MPEWPSYGKFCEVIQNPHFLKKCKGGTKETFSKIAKKNSPRLQGLKAIWRKWHYLPISMHLKCKDWKRMTKLWQFWQRHPRPAFSEKRAKGRPREIFQKSPKKMPTFEKPQKHSGAKNIILLFSMHLKCKDCKRFWRKKRIQKFPNG